MAERQRLVSRIVLKNRLVALVRQRCLCLVEAHKPRSCVQSATRKAQCSDATRVSAAHERLGRVRVCLHATHVRPRAQAHSSAHTRRTRTKHSFPSSLPAVSLWSRTAFQCRSSSLTEGACARAIRVALSQFFGRLRCRTLQGSSVQPSQAACARHSVPSGFWCSFWRCRGHARHAASGMFSTDARSQLGRAPGAVLCGLTEEGCYWLSATTSVSFSLSQPAASSFSGRPAFTM